MSDDTLMAVADSQAPTAEDDQATLIDLDSIFNKKEFWANKSDELPDDLKQLLEAKARKDKPHLSDEDVEEEVEVQLSVEKLCRNRILNHADKSGDIQSLEQKVSSARIAGTLTKRWLSSRFLHQDIPECIRNAVWTPNDDHKLVDGANPRQSVLDLLTKIRGKDPKGFRGLKYTSDTTGKEANGFAHYIGKPNFRHGGTDDVVPDKVFIAAPTPPDIDTSNLVHVYYEESGSGKTVELAASAYTRDALFTIMLNTTDVQLLDSPDDDEVKNDRKINSWKKLAHQVESVLTEDKTSLGRLGDFLQMLDGKMQEKTTLLIVVGIDEASKSPNFVRAIIDSYNDFGTDLGGFIRDICAEKATNQAGPSAVGASQGSSNADTLPCVLNHIDIKVLFSVAGTGADQTRVGSNHKNFTHLDTSAKVNAADVYHILRSEYVKDEKNTIIPEYKELEHSPLLKAIVDSNARMISIYMRASKRQENINRDQGKKSSENEYEQNAILSKTFKVFMKSNGMSTLVNNPYLARLTASQALAVLLFQQDKDFSEKLSDKQLNNMDYGITFQRFKGDLGGSIMRRLVVDYGLVTARPLTGDDKSKPQASPFALTGAMQLLCLWLIQGGEATAAEKSFLGTTSTSFETLTALLAGAAIAASSVVKKDDDGRVLAAPANGSNSDTIQQQEADIFAALGKVGMKINPYPDADQPTRYTCKTIDGEQIVNERAGSDFWTLKRTHLALLPRDLKIPRVYFHKSMITSVKSDADKERIMASTLTQLQEGTTAADIQLNGTIDAARAQLQKAIDAAVDAQLTEAITADVAAQFKEAITAAVDAQLTEAITGAVAAQLKEATAADVDAQLKEAIAAAVDVQLKEAITGDVAAQFKEATAAARAELKESIADAVDAQLAEAIAIAAARAQLTEATAADVDAQLKQAIAADVDARLTEAITGDVAAQLEKSIAATVDARLTEATAADVDAQLKQAIAATVDARLTEAITGDVAAQLEKSIAAAVDAQRVNDTKAAVDADVGSQFMEAIKAAAVKRTNDVDAATAKALGAIFRNMDAMFMSEGRCIRRVPLKGGKAEDITDWLKSCHPIFVDRDLLHQLRVLWEAEQQCHDQQDHKQKAPTVPQAIHPIAAAGINNSTNTSHKALDGDAKPAAVAVAAPAPANASHSTTTDVVELIFNLPLIHVAEGSSEFADAYVTFLTEKTDTTGKKIYSLRTICIQAKDYSEDTSPKMAIYEKNASAVANPGLHPLFGEDRIYTAAGTRSAVAWNSRKSFPYVPFVVDDSFILKNQMEAMSMRRSKTAKHGAHAVLCLAPRRTKRARDDPASTTLRRSKRAR